ncbi:hypothetical protein EYS14_09310 [Alteromonadaceae bacterium M269]|nr:hypothetical protein EYS14_09310 [Alteromonadaceae bacterium M269]
MTSQDDIFNNQQTQVQFAELCNALYERELSSLAQSSSKDHRLLKRRLAGLSYHVKRVAEQLLQHETQMTVDIHNASWQAKQSATCVANRIKPEQTKEWFLQHAQYGMPVPVHVQLLGTDYIELDSIDRIDHQQQKLHLNKNRWFSFDGVAIVPESEDQAACALTKSVKRLVKPTPSVLTAACCGHSWNHRGKTQPRVLPIRELMLSTAINWKALHKLKHKR